MLMRLVPHIPLPFLLFLSQLWDVTSFL
jgi:hypothetical protein